MNVHKIITLELQKREMTLSTDLLIMTRQKEHKKGIGPKLHNYDYH